MLSRQTTLPWKTTLSSSSANFVFSSGCFLLSQTAGAVRQTIHAKNILEPQAKNILKIYIHLLQLLIKIYINK